MKLANKNMFGDISFHRIIIILTMESLNVARNNTSSNGIIKYMLGRLDDRGRGELQSLMAGNG